MDDLPHTEFQNTYNFFFIPYFYFHFFFFSYSYTPMINLQIKFETLVW